MQSHTIAEHVILPVCKEIVKSVLEDGIEKYHLVLLSNDTIFWQIDDMSLDIQCYVHEKLSDGQVFSLQLDESVD